MSRYIKKHREEFAWIIFPLFCLIILGGISFTVFPGWIKPAYSTLGAPCVLGATDSSDPLLTACDVCRQEACSLANPNTTMGVCTQEFRGLPCPMCRCTTTFVTFVGGTAVIPASNCVAPNDDFCQDISGGQAENACRVGSCIGDTTFDRTNPTGCDFDYDTANIDCINCAPPTDPDINCGNGVCEQEIGEDFDTCSEDCQTPGFPFATPLAEGDPILNSACMPPTLSFGGNILGSDACEDGDVCTTNECETIVGGPEFCNVEPAACDGNSFDFCCPDGCNPPPDGPGTCNTAIDPNCDEDCLPPQVCEPSPSPTPIPPASFLEISGTSLICSLGDRRPSGNSLKGAYSLACLAFAVAGLVYLRKREAK